jgi:hypothetical protein
MKVIDPIIVGRGFGICKGIFDPYEENIQTVEDTSTDFKFSQIFILMDGSGSFYGSVDVVTKDGYGNPVSTTNGAASDWKFNAWDLRDFYKRSYKFVAGDRGAKWMCINPLPANGFFDFEIIQSGSKVISGENGKQNVIVCITGPIFINNKQIDQYKYSRILGNTIANIEIPQGCAALYMHR